MRLVLATLFAFAAGSYGAVGYAQLLDQDTVRMYLEKSQIGVNGRVDVTIGEIDPRLRLAPCARVEPFIPTGARLWGRSSIGVRCIEGASWSTYLPIQVRIYAPALVASRALVAGQEIGPDDVRVEEIELTREPPGVLTDPAQLADRLLLRAVNPGQSLRADQMRVRPVVNAGDQVKVSYVGPGFVVAAEGRALSQAGNGQNVRVQTEAGKILSGIARPGRIVEVRS